MKIFFHRRLLMLLGVLLVSCAVAGCATTLVYNHADWLLLRQLDGYFDLSRSQKAFVSARLDTILDRHRQEALPRYEAVIRQVQMRIQSGLTEADLDWAFTQYDQLRADLFGRFAHDGADFVRLVEDRQVVRLRKALHYRLVDHEQLLHQDTRARLVTRSERILTLVKEWLGPVTRQQEQVITRLAMEFPDTLPAWYAHQLRRNDQLIRVVESRHRDDAPAQLHEWLVNQERADDPAFLETSRQLKQHIAQLILTLERIATSEQRRHVLAKLDDLAQTVHALRRA